jgi:hypothetical protein
MTLDELRTEFTAFCSAREAARLDGWRVAFSGEPLPERISDRYADLVSLSAIDDLRRERERTKTAFEAERRGVRLLLACAEAEFLERQCRATDLELTRAVHRPYIAWRDERLSALQAAERAAREPNRAERRALAQKLDSFLASVADLRAERRERLRDGAGALGYASFGEYFRRREADRQRDVDRLAQCCETLLAATDEAHAALLRRWRTDAGFLKESPLRADARARDAQPIGDREFPARKLAVRLEDVLRGLGVRPGQQSNLRRASLPDDATAPVVARVAVPDDIRFAWRAADGWRAYATTFHAAAHAQRAAWTSARLPVELRCANDPALDEAFGALFAGLTREARWLGEALDISDPKTSLRSVRERRLMKLRFDAARFLGALRQCRDATPATDEDLARLLTETTGVVFSPGEAAEDVADGLCAGVGVYAAMFEVQFRDYLKTRYGAWWTSPRAGDALIDLWNTGSYYTLGELAKHIGLGEIAPDALLEELHGA